MSQSLLNLNDKLLIKGLLNYIEGFGELHNLWPKNKEQKSFIAISGGADSMLLIYCVSEILKHRGLPSPIALHVNYGTRKESDYEQQLCEEFCRELKLEMHTLKLEGLSLESKNFEKRARDIRYDYFKSFLKKDDLLYMGHHLDDCLEWSFMMSLKSSRLKVRLGTPVRNGNTRRPFHCLSKQQILNLCKRLNINFANDSSNDSVVFERNKIRKLLSDLKLQYPNLLKNFVTQQRELLELYQTSKLKEFKISYCKFGGAIVTFENLKEIGDSHLSKILTEFIQKYSKKERGKLRDQLTALIEGQKKSKMGPYAFSGDVLIYPMPNGFYILSRDIQNKWNDEFLNTQIPNFNHPIIQILDIDSSKHQKVARNIHPLVAVLKNKILEESYGWAYKL